jgi:hypothetical protein
MVADGKLMQKTDCKILVIAVWLGNWPAYFPFFLKSIGHPGKPDFLIVGDQVVLPPVPGNVGFKRYSIKQLNELASERLNFKTSITNGLKLCDFKPVYGKIFQNHLQGYDYWGYCDIDLILGDSIKFIPPLVAGEPDVVSFYPGFLSGPFCLFRNNEKTINLYTQIPSHRTVLKSPVHHAFDENIVNPSNKLSGVRTAGLKIRYLAGFPFNPGAGGFKPAEIAYRFQWYVKQHTLIEGQPEDMTDLIFQEKNNGRLKAVFTDLLSSDREFRRLGRKDWDLSWHNGTLMDMNYNREIFGFHFVDMKNQPCFNVPGPDAVPDAFRLTRKGFEI